MNPLRPFLPKGLHPYRVLGGYFADLRLLLDLQCEFQHYLGLYEYELLPHWRRLGRGCRSVIDLGAAKGELAVRFLLRADITSVVAVEPSAPELEQFARNLALNGVADDPRLHLHRGYAGAGAGPEWCTLDQLAQGLAEPILVKIDIDGPESDVLRTGSALLRRDCRFVIETHSPEAEAGCIAQLEAAGYRTRIINPAWWRRVLPERRIVAHNRWLVAARAPLEP
jgi:precorrin-6B methylase 2